MSSYSITLTNNPTYSRYQTNIGETDPPFRPILSIAYNGSYWLMGGYETVKETVISTYPEVVSLQALYDTNYLAARNTLIQKKLSEKIELYNPDGFNDTTNYDTLYQEYADLADSYKSQIISTTASLDASGAQKINHTRRTLHTMAISYDGLTWILLENNPFSKTITKPTDYVASAASARVNSISWNGTMWVAVGYAGSGTDVKSQIATSTDGINWTPRGSAGVWWYGQLPVSPFNLVYQNYQGECRSVANGGGYWITVGQIFGIDLPFDEETQTSPDLEGTIAKSSDGINWEPVPNSLSDAYAVAYNGSLWVAGGAGSGAGGNHCIVTSSNNGTSWQGRFPYNESTETATITNKILAIAWNGSYWIALGERSTTSTSGEYSQVFSGIAVKSTNGIDWTLTDNIPIFRSVSWDGNFWNAIGGEGLYKSDDGITWTSKSISGNQISGFAVASNIVLPILGGTISTVNSFIVGFGTPMSVLRSYNDDTNWISQAIDGEGTNFVGNLPKEFHDVIWTGSKWVIVGEPLTPVNSLRNIAVSDTGIDWTFPTNTLSIVRGIAYNGTKYIAVSEGGVGFSKAATSSDASSWTSVSISLSKAYCVAWNGSYWVVGGVKGTGNATVKSTDNGSTWIESTLCPLTTINKIAWNGYYWLAVGIGESHTIALSLDGVRWYSANPDTNPFTQAHSIAWNKDKWIAVGEGTNTIATSVDGYTWTPQGSDVFRVSGTNVSWNGSKWIASGYGYYPMASSTDGETWTIFDTRIEKVNSYANKTISLPFTGANSSAILSQINLIVADLTSKTNSTVSAEEALAELLADEQAAAAAAAAALAARNTTKATAASYRIKLLFWKDRINKEFSILSAYKDSLTNSVIPYTLVNIESVYPYEYLLSKGFNTTINIFAEDLVTSYATIFNDTKSQAELDVALAEIKTSLDTIDTGLVDYYTRTLFLFDKIATDTASAVTSQAFETILINYKYLNNTQKTSVLAFYNAAKSGFNTQITNIKNIFTTPVTSVSYSVDISDYDYTPYVLSGETIDLSTITITNADFIGKNLDGFIVKNATVVGNQNASRPITFFINKILKTSAPDSYNLYRGAILITDVLESLTNYTKLLRLNGSYKISYDRQQICDDYNADSITIANSWNQFVNAVTNESEINSKFVPYYTTYFYTLIDPLLPVPVINDIVVRYCKTIYESYTSPGAYPLVLGLLYNSMKNTVDSIDVIKDAAINYGLSRKNTTIKAKLDTFKQDVTVDYIGPLNINTYLNTLVNETYYESSVLRKSYKTLAYLKNGRYLYGQLYPLILGIKYADLDAEADGAKPPKTGWGGLTAAQGVVTGAENIGENLYKISTNSVNLRDLQVGFPISFYSIIKPQNNFIVQYRNKTRYTITAVDSTSFTIQGDSVLFNEEFAYTIFPFSVTETGNVRFVWEFKLEGADRGVQGNNGWNSFNNTYFARQKLANFIRERTFLGRISGLVDDNNQSVFVNEASLTWPDFLEFTRTATYDTIVSLKSDLEQTVAEINSNLFLTNQYADNIVTQDLALIDSYYPIQGQVVLTNIFNSVTLSLPSQSDLTTYGSFKLTERQVFSFALGQFITRPESLTLQQFYDGIQSNYTTLTNLKNTNIASYTPIQVKNIIISANQAKTNIENLQNDSIELLNVIADYKERFASANEYVDRVEDRVNRYVNLYNKITNGDPFAVGEEFSGASSNPFIVSISPSNTTYWTERTRAVVIRNNVKQELTGSLPALLLSDYSTYSSTESYREEDIVVYNSALYRCVVVGTFDGDTSLTITNIVPTNTAHWRPITYPIVEYAGKNIEATPEFCAPLNYLDFGYYDNNWLYYEGDMVAYNGKIYECTNVVPPASSATIINIPPTNTSRWIVNDKQLAAFGIANWENTKFYNIGTRVVYRGDIYTCSRNTIDYEPPTTSLLDWEKVTINSVGNIPREYSSTINYGINSLVTHKTYNPVSDTYTLFVYRCYATEGNEPIPYTYPIFYISDEEDENGDYKIKKESNGTYLLSNVPRHGPPGNDTDPFCMLGFARGLRRRVAMYIDMPYEWAKRLTFNANAEILTSKYNFDLNYVSFSGKTAAFTALKNRIASSVTSFNQLQFGINDMYDKAYENLYETLKTNVKQIIALQTAINVIKTQYFNNPATQSRVYDKPFKFLNPISDALDDVRQFRDLGVGDLADMRQREAETNYLFKTTQAEYDYYYTNQPRIEDLEADIYDKKFFCETVIAYDLTVRSSNTLYPIGAVIYCDSANYGINVPISDYGGLSYYENPPENSILGQITACVKESARPPEYVTDRNLASALTWESKNQALIGLSYFTKGLVGFTAAAFQAAVPDPLAIFGIMNFVSGGAIPNYLSVTWPTFRDYTQSKTAYKKQVNAIREKYKIGTTTSGGKTYIAGTNTSIRELDDFLSTLGGILLDLYFMRDDIKLNYRPPTTTVSYSAQIPDIPSPTYVPPKPPVDPPDPDAFEFDRSIEERIRKTRAALVDLEEQKRVLRGKKPRPPTLGPLPKISNASTVANSGNLKPRKYAIPNTDYGKFNPARIATDSNKSTWQQKVGTVAENPEKVVNTQQPRVTKEEVEALKEERNRQMADYEKRKADWNTEMRKISEEQANKGSSLAGDKELLKDEELKAAEAQQRQDAAYRQKAENLQKFETEQIEARQRYHKALAEYDIAKQNAKDLSASNAARGAIEEAQLELESKRSAVTTSKVDYDGKTVTVTIAIQEFEDALLEPNKPLSTYLFNKLPPSVRARYAAVIARLGPLFRTYRRWQVAVSMSPPVRIFRTPTARKLMAGVGVLAQVAAVGLTMWQSGVFDEEL